MIDPAPAGARQIEHRRRVEQVREVLDRRGLRGAFLEARATVAWLTVGGTTHVDTATERGVAGLVIDTHEAVLLTTNIEANRLRAEEVDGLDLEVVAVGWWEPGGLVARARAMLGAEPAGDADLEADLVDLRSRLAAIEHARLAELGRLVAGALDAALDATRPGDREDAIAARIAAALPGVRLPVVLVAADERIARYRHPLPGESTIRDRVMLVAVAERWGLHVAATRFREFRSPDRDLEARFRAVRAVQDAAHAASRAGATLGDVFESIRAGYAEAGFPDEWRDHHQGGTIGYRSRERIAVPGDTTRLEPGMALAWNPSIRGAKAEDTIIVVAGDPAHSVTVADRS